MTDQRMTHLYDLLTSSGFDAVAFNPGPSLTYLTGLHFHLMERPTVLVIKPGNTPLLILPELEAGKLAHSRLQVNSFTFNDNPATWAAVFQKALASLDLNHGKIAVEPNQMRFLELDFLKKGAPQVEFVSGGKPALLTPNQKRLRRDQCHAAGREHRPGCLERNPRLVQGRQHRKGNRF